jgi:hypothetical protein
VYSTGKISTLRQCDTVLVCKILLVSNTINTNQSSLLTFHKLQCHMRRYARLKAVMLGADKVRTDSGNPQKNVEGLVADYGKSVC